MNNWETIKMGDSKLVMHCGSKKATWDDILKIETPEPEGRWMPVPHARVVEEVVEHLDRAGLQVTESAYALDNGGQRFFSLLGLDVKGGDGEYQLVVGARNSHDKTFPISMAVGSRVFVCDNLAFSSEIQVTRRHTKNVMDDFPRLIATACGRIKGSAEDQERRFAHYRDVNLSDTMVHDILVQSLDIKAIGSTALPKVLQEWREPRHEEFAKDHSAWRLWNAYTEILKEYDVMALSSRTTALQGLMDVYTRMPVRPIVAEALAV